MTCKSHVNVNHLHLQAQTLYTYNVIGYNLFFIFTQGCVNALGHVSVSVYILYIISEYTYLQSILISYKCIPKFNVCFVWKTALIDPSKKNHDINLFSKFYQYGMW